MASYRVRNTQVSTLSIFDEVPSWQHIGWRLTEPEGKYDNTASTNQDTQSCATQANYDSPWKEALELYFEPAIALLMPELHAQIDWSQPVIFRDKEFQSISHRMDSGVQFVDKLAQVSGRDGRPVLILIHIEIQSDKSGPALLRIMAERMTFYAFRMYDGIRPDTANQEAALVSMAILTNSTQGPGKLRHGWSFMGSACIFKCPVIHLGQWWNRWKELEATAKTNPFAVVIMAQLLAHRHAKAHKTTRDQGKLASMEQLARMLYTYGYSRDAIISVLRLIEWMMRLPEALEPAYQQTIRTLEEERTMSYVFSFERTAKAEGMAIGRSEGKQEGISSVLQRLLSRKFGPLPDWVQDKLQKADNDTLLSWSERVLFADSLEAVFGD